MYQELAVGLPVGVTIFTAVSPVQAAARIPRATAVVLPAAGHMAHIDDRAAR